MEIEIVGELRQETLRAKVQVRVNAIGVDVDFVALSEPPQVHFYLGVALLQFLIVQEAFVGFRHAEASLGAK